MACFLKDVHIPRLITPAEKGRDLEPRVIDAYIIQCQAEAQEGSVFTPSGWNTALVTIKLCSLIRCLCDVSLRKFHVGSGWLIYSSSLSSHVITVTIARAIELKHNATLIAALAFETANFYQKAGLYFFFHHVNQSIGVEVIFSYTLLMFC